MAVQATQEDFIFLKPEYYPKSFPRSVKYILSQGGDVLSAGDLCDLIGNWHLNEAVSLIAEALQGYPHEQRTFFEFVLRGVAQDRNYFFDLRRGMEDFFRGIRPLVQVSVRGRRLTNSHIHGCDFLDYQYARAASGWKRRGDTVCFLTYPSLAYLPRVLDAYRDSERPVLLNLKVSLEQEGRCYHIIPARWDDKTLLSVAPLTEKEYMSRGEAMFQAGANFVVAPE